MHQPLLGAAIPLLIAAVIYACHCGRAPFWLLLAAPPAMLAGAVWAVIPDLPRLFGAQALYRRLATDPRTDIFFWHYSIDRMEAAFLDRWTPLFNALFALMLLLLLAAAWRELKRAEEISKAYRLSSTTDRTNPTDPADPTDHRPPPR